MKAFLFPLIGFAVTFAAFSLPGIGRAIRFRRHARAFDRAKEQLVRAKTLPQIEFHAEQCSTALREMGKEIGK